MSAATSPGPASRSRSPKRKRSTSEESGVEQYNGQSDAALQYAYDDELPSDAEQALSPEDEPSRKRVRFERPRSLDYVPHLTLRGHKRGVAAAKFSPDGRWIASCCKSANATDATFTDYMKRPIARSRSGTRKQGYLRILSRVTLPAFLPLLGAQTQRY